MKKLISGNTVFIREDDAKALPLAELNAHLLDFAKEGLTVEFVRFLPSQYSVKSAIEQLKVVDLSAACAALSALRLDKDTKTQLEEIQKYVAALDFQPQLGPYKFHNDFGLEGWSQRFSITPTTVRCNGYGLSQTVLKRLATVIIEVWQADVKYPRVVRVTSRDRDLSIYENYARLGCQEYTRAHLESLFVRLGYITPDGVVTI